MSVIYVQKLRLIFFSVLFSFIVPASVFGATFTWQGPYVGAYVGDAFASSHLSTSTGRVTVTSYFPTLSDSNAVNHAGSDTKDPSSLIAGTI